MIPAPSYIPPITIRPLETDFLMFIDEYTANQESMPQIVGQTPFGFKYVSRGNGGGRVEGPKIRGTIVECCDYFTELNGNGIVDWRGAFRTDDGALVYAEMGGFVHEYPESGDKPGTGMKNFLSGAGDYMSYYFRTNCKFWCGNEKYMWLNGLVCVGVGEYVEGHMRYSVYAMK